MELLNLTISMPMLLLNTSFSEIISWLHSLDTSIFLFLNGMHSEFFDGIMYFFSDKVVWFTFYAALLFVFIRFWKKDAVWIILALVLCIVLADQLSGVIKDLVQRPRPSRVEELEGLVHIVNQERGGRFGFVSSHAANTFGLALFCSLLLRRKAYPLVLFPWAAIIAYSRIYLGVHYPFDVLGGIIVGLSAALLCYWLLKKFRPGICSSEVEYHSSTDTSSFFNMQCYLPLWSIAVTTGGIIICSALFFYSM